MGQKATMSTIGIFTGKQKDYNQRVLTLLYDYGPLTAWELTGKMTQTGKVSLHATLNKRLRDLEEKEYLQKCDTKWHLRFKGIIAVLLIQPTPKIWNEKWKEVFDIKEKMVAEYSKPLLDSLGMDLHSALKSLGLCLDDFTEWVSISKKVKELMEKGLLNFDIIKEQTLLANVIVETMTLEQLTKIWSPNQHASDRLTDSTKRE